MAEKFYTIITDIGKAKIANCISQATKVDFVKMKVGDGGGKYYNPIETQTDLINTVWEGDIGHVVVDKENPNWINIEVILPADVGGFMIREYGVFDSENNLLAIAKCAETYKPVAAEGSTKELNMKMILAISNIDSITLKIDPALMYAKKKDLDVISNKVNELEDKLNKHIDDSLYQEAGGTATAITLSMLTLKNGYSKTFIATANNNGSATTINGKPLYKPGTTTGPNIKEGKAYTVWYNSVSDCFFLQASAEGNVGAEHVLAGYTFSNDDDTGLVGAMPNNTGTNKELSLNETWVIPKGYHDGNGRVTQNIPNNGAMNANLNCGQSKDIPAGYTNGGRITANSLASQTPANADASTIIAGRNAWVNGNLINGNASVQSLGGKKFSTGSFGEIASNATVTASFGFRPSAIVGYSGSWAVLSFIVGSTAGGGLYSVRTAAVCATISLKDDGFLLYNTGKGGIIPGLTWCAYE